MNGTAPLQNCTAPVHGLVLAGGASSRMRHDKAALMYHGRPQLQWTLELAGTVCERTFVSVRADQAADPLRSAHAQIVDCVALGGPLAGILSALLTHRDVAWLVLACDLPFVDRATLAHLLAHRDAQGTGTAFRSAHDGMPEPLCAIFEPHALEPMQAFVAQGGNCPRKFLLQSGARLLDLPDPRVLQNVNTIEERVAALRILSG